MSAEPYDWQRDEGLFFSDDARDEPTLEEVKERIAYYEAHPATHPLDAAVQP